MPALGLLFVIMRLPHSQIRRLTGDKPDDAMEVDSNEDEDADAEGEEQEEDIEGVPLGADR